MKPINWNFIKREILTIPNIISLFRLFLIPHILRLYMNYEYDKAAAWIVISLLSDIADGFIARHFNMVSGLGKVLDPIADKMTQGMIFICLVLRYRWLVWFTCLFGFKELTVFYLGFLSLMYTRELNSAKWYGKLCTGVVVACIIIMVIFPALPPVVLQILSGVCVAVLLFSLVMYARFYQNHINLKTSKIPRDHTANMPGVVFAWFLTVAVGVAVIAGRNYLISSEVSVFIAERKTAIAAVMFIIILLKAVGFPIYIGELYMICGFLFGIPEAIVFCAVCGLAASAIQYVRGIKIYGEYVQELRNRLSCIEAYSNLRNKCSLLFVALSRLMCLPTELVGAYMGAIRIGFGSYLAGSFLGRLPDMIIFSVMGSHLGDITSWEFISSVAIKLVWSCLVCLALYFYGKKLEKTRIQAETE